MKRKAHGQVRRSQVITTYGPGALIDLPQESAIVAGLDEWPPAHKLEAIDEPRLQGSTSGPEPRLARKLQVVTGVTTVQLLAPPPVSSDPSAAPTGIGAWRFPEWFIVQAADAEEGTAHTRSRRLVHRKALDDKHRFEGRDLVATRFVRGCPRGHVDDLDWRRFVHRRGSECPPTRPLWLDEQGTTGDLTDLVVRCECGATRRLSDASMIEINPLGPCRGARPWLGRDTNEECNQPSRLLVRTASTRCRGLHTHSPRFVRNPAGAGSGHATTLSWRMRSCAKSYCACRRTQNAALLQPMRSNASAIAGEMPVRPFSSREKVCRVQPSFSAASVTVQPSAASASRRLSPGCAGSYIVGTVPPLVVVDQGHANGYPALEAEDDSPVAGNPHAPVASTIAGQRVQTIAGQIHVSRLCRSIKVRQDTPNPRDERRREAAGLAPPVEGQEPLVNDLDVVTVTRCMTCDTTQRRGARHVLLEWRRCLRPQIRSARDVST